jgi:serine/threonine protein kinase/tetratricopeptide (TPR) repeat protein
MATADRNLLFGLLALQNGLIDQGALVAAFQAWTRDKARALADHLAARGDLDADARAGLDAIVALHLRKHGDVEKSLAAVAAGRSTRERLGQLADPEIERTLAHVGSGSPEPDHERTASYAVGTVTSDGQRFRVLRPHARGGLGAVFVALDEELHREVALKQILDHHADEAATRQRFLLEAEITGGLEHPGIVPVYGLGTYGDGRPYYAMRFIRGDSLGEAIAHYHADDTLKEPPGRRSLELRKLLRRFMDLCNAIGYAHSRGVLHRDIKPGNVIVGNHGETLVVDWGLAKATGKSEPGAEERTLSPLSTSGSAETLPGSALGTPAFMSPEQARGEIDRLGPRSDVYSLGATLYCLLTGKAPQEEDDLGEVLRRVQRGELTPPRRIDPSIDPALEAACLKAMAFRPEDRYAGCRTLTDDIERWMADEAVTAWREPWTRTLMRWLTRHRTGVTGAAAGLLAAVVGLTALAAQQALWNAALGKANGQTLVTLGEAREARDATKAALNESEESRKQADAVGSFLVDALKRPDPSVDGRDVTVADVLDQAAAGLERGFSGSKATEGALLDALGRSYSGLGLPQQAEESHRKARAVRQQSLGASHRDTLRSATQHARTLWDIGRQAESEAAHEAVLAREEALLGRDDPDTLETRYLLANAYALSGRAAKAIPLHHEILATREAKLGPDHPDTLNSRAGLALAYWSAGRVADAIRLNEATLKANESKLGPDHTQTIQTRSMLGTAYLSAGRTADAIGLYEANLKAQESKLRPDHPATLLSRGALASAYLAAGRVADAIRLNEVTLKANESKLGPDHAQTSLSRNNLATAYMAAGRTADAIGMYQANLKAQESRYGPDDPATHLGRSNLAFACQAAGRLTEAEALFGETLARRGRRQKPDSPVLAGDLAALGRNLMKQGRFPDAEPLLREGLAIYEKSTPDEWRRFSAASMLGGVLAAQARYAEAEPLVIGGHEGLHAREAKIPSNLKYYASEAAERVVRLYEAWGKPEQAREWGRKLRPLELPADVFAH